jgi:outer membrane protein TolC
MLLLCIAAAGCLETKDRLKYFGDPDLNYYREVATQIDAPTVSTPTADEAAYTAAPRRIRDLGDDDTELWDLPLADAIHLALANSRIIRQRDQFLSPNNPLLANPAVSSSVYDSAIQESATLNLTTSVGGSRGVEAALADFDAQLTTNVLWGRDETLQNSLILSGGLPPGSTLTEESGTFSTRLEKQMATGGSFAVVHNWNYSLNNVPSRLFGSSYTGQLRTEYRHPLWAGAGTEFTRIAGPINRSGIAIAGVSQGVVISRINNDITLADFEASVRNLLRDVESLYWDLALSYRVYHSEIVARNSALQTYFEVKARYDVGTTSLADQSQAGDNYYETRDRAENALADLYQTEGQLRRLIGLPVNDGRIIRPVDEPAVAEFVPDWHFALAEALTRRVELRRQKWNIKSLELQHRAARSLTHPRFDFVSAYQVNAFGDHLFGETDADGVTFQGLNSAYETLTQGSQTGWNLGFEFSMPFGFRAAHAQVRNLELQMAKARSALATQELEISHGLSQAFQQLDRWYGLAGTNFNRRRFAQERVQATRAEYDVGRTSLDLVLRAQISLAQAEIAFFRSLMEYNKAIAEVHFRKGSLLEFNQVHLAEGGWDPQAYQDAMRRAWARSHALDAKRLHTKPEEFVVGGGARSASWLPGSEAILPVDDSTPDGETELAPSPESLPIPESNALIPPQADHSDASAAETLHSTASSLESADLSDATTPPAMDPVSFDEPEEQPQVDEDGPATSGDAAVETDQAPEVWVLDRISGQAGKGRGAYAVSRTPSGDAAAAEPEQAEPTWILDQTPAQAGKGRGAYAVSRTPADDAAAETEQAERTWILDRTPGRSGKGRGADALPRAPSKDAAAETEQAEPTWILDRTPGRSRKGHGADALPRTPSKHAALETEHAERTWILDRTPGRAGKIRGVDALPRTPSKDAALETEQAERTWILDRTLSRSGKGRGADALPRHVDSPDRAVPLIFDWQDSTTGSRSGGTSATTAAPATKRLPIILPSGNYRAERIPSPPESDARENSVRPRIYRWTAKRPRALRNTLPTEFVPSIEPADTNPSK